MAGARIHFDTTELKHLEIDLKNAPRRVRSPQGVRRAAKEIEREMRVDAAGHVGSYFHKSKRHKKPTDLPRHVSSEMTGPLSAEIGIENKGAGKLGGIIAYGSVNNAPAYDPGAGPRRAMSRVLDEIADHGEEATLGRRGQG